MKSQRFKYRRVGWLLAVIFTFGFTAYAGQVAESYASHRQSVKVECTLSVCDFDDAKALESAKKWTSSAPGHVGPKLAAQVLRLASLHHDHLAAVALAACSGKFAYIEIFVPFISDQGIGLRTDRNFSHPPAG